LRCPDDNILDLDVGSSQLEQVRIPIFYITNSDATYMHDVLISTEDSEKIKLKITHQSLIDYAARRIEIFMSPQLINNPMI
jgi:hypothetical protein